MKTISTFLLLLSCLCGISQTTITSVANGNANNPLTWDCTCFPTPSDHIIVDHDVVMNVDWVINNGGSITVNPGASFIQDANYRSILVDGVNSEFNNEGTAHLTNMAVTNGGATNNDGTFTLDTALYIDTASSFYNQMDILGLDSTFNQGALTNIGEFNSGNFWNDGTVANSYNIMVDSMWNTGVFNSSAGGLWFTDFGNEGEFYIAGTANMLIQNNFFNTGILELSTNQVIIVDNDFWTGDSMGGNALISNFGTIEVHNDFVNTGELDGSGVYCIANNSTNTGDVGGTLDICDNTGTGYFDFNSGSIDVLVTDCISNCYVGEEELEEITFDFYPNPAFDQINIRHDGYSSIKIVALTGEVIYSNNNQVNNIDLSELSQGIYFLTVTKGSQTVTKKMIKQ